MEVKDTTPRDTFDCYYCENTYSTERALSIHLVSCHAEPVDLLSDEDLKIYLTNKTGGFSNQQPGKNVRFFKGNNPNSCNDDKKYLSLDAYTEHYYNQQSMKIQNSYSVEHYNFSHSNPYPNIRNRMV